MFKQNEVLFTADMNAKFGPDNIDKEYNDGAIW